MKIYFNLNMSIFKSKSLQSQGKKQAAPFSKKKEEREKKRKNQKNKKITQFFTGSKSINLAEFLTVLEN